MANGGNAVPPRQSYLLGFHIERREKTRTGNRGKKRHRLSRLGKGGGGQRSDERIIGGMGTADRNVRKEVQGRGQSGFVR